MIFSTWCMWGIISFAVGEIASGFKYGCPSAIKSIEETKARYPMICDSMNNPIKYWSWFILSSIIGASVLCLLGPISALIVLINIRGMIGRKDN